MLLRLALAACALWFAGSAWADLFKCVGKDGNVSYQSEECAGNSRESRLKSAIPEASEAGPGGVGVIDVNQAARRIANRQGRPTVVLLYSTACPRSQRMFPEFVAVANKYRARGIEFVVLSTDDEEDFGRVPQFLAARKAPFEAVAIKPWASGSLTRAMAPLGIDVGATWNLPLMVVKDANGRVMRQTEAATDLSSLRAALDSLAK